MRGASSRCLTGPMTSGYVGVSSDASGLSYRRGGGLQAVPEIHFMTATELVRLVRSKELSAREILETHLVQIERVNPKVNAIVTLTAEEAMNRARIADDASARRGEIGPLHGLPVAHKDLAQTKGIR